MSKLANLDDHQNAAADAKQKQRQHGRPIAEIIVNGDERRPHIDVVCSAGLKLIEVISEPHGDDWEGDRGKPKSAAVIRKLDRNWSVIGNGKDNRVRCGARCPPCVEHAKEQTKTRASKTEPFTFINVEEERQ